jgi:hypothetical protein
MFLSMPVTNVLLFLHLSERYRDQQCCVSGTPGTGTFCISGTGTGMHSGSQPDLDPDPIPVPGLDPDPA